MSTGLRPLPLPKRLRPSADSTNRSNCFKNFSLLAADSSCSCKLQLVTTPRRFSLNPFEEAYRFRTLLMGYHTYRLRLAITLRDLFSPCLDYSRFGVASSCIDPDVPFDPVIYAYGDTPSPAIIQDMPSRRHVILMPINVFEPGSDTLLYKRSVRILIPIYLGFWLEYRTRCRWTIHKI